MRTVLPICMLGALLAASCDSGPQEAVWEDLGFPEPSGYALFLEGDDLYVGAGHDGLWALDLRSSGAEWEYLGHRVTDGERHFESGVQAVDVYQGKITIGYADPPVQPDGQRIGLWCSGDRGVTWAPCDDGARQLLGGVPWSSARSITRSRHDGDQMLIGDGSVHKSVDGGDQWGRVYPEPEFPYRFTSLHFGLAWHPVDPALIWAYGETGRFQPWLMRSTDGGTTWEEHFRINVPRDNAFFSMAFDPVDPDIMYVGAQGAVIRSTKGGAEWMGDDPVPALFTDSRGNFFYALQVHPRLPGILFAAAGPRLYASRNHGGTARLLDTPEGLTFILDMWYDGASEALYVAGDGGVFRLRNPLGAIP